MSKQILDITNKNKIVISIIAILLIAIVVIVVLYVLKMDHLKELK